LRCGDIYRKSVMFLEERVYETRVFLNNKYSNIDRRVKYK